MAGLYFEEFSEGQVFEHAVTRTVTSSRSGSRNSTASIASFPGAVGSTTTARTCRGMGVLLSARTYSDVRRHSVRAGDPS